MNPYQYCTRCGAELSDHLKQRYQEDHERGPVLCQSCIIEIFRGIPEAFQSMFQAVMTAFTNAFTTTEDANDE